MTISVMGDPMISVLCVDDEPGLLKIAKIFLERDKDLSVKTVTSALEGLSAISIESFDAIVSDYQMPEMDGIEFLKRVRSLNGVPFILFTGRGREEVAIEAINNGVDFYLQKGLEPKSQFAELAHKIKHAVNKRRLEALLVKSEQKFHTFADYTHDWEYWQSEDNAYVYISPSCEQITGYTPEEFNADPNLLYNIIHTDDRDKWKNHHEEESQLKGSLSLEIRIVRKDGEIRWISHRCQPVTDVNGNTLGLRTGNRDITRQKQDEGKIFAAYKQLAVQDKILKQQYEFLRMTDVIQKESTRFLDDIFSSIQDGISILDQDLTVLKVNATMERWYAHAMPLVGKKCYEACHVRTEPCKNCPALQTLRTGKAAMEMVPKSGPDSTTVDWLELYSFPLIDSQTGKMNGIIEYARDITQRRQIETELAKSEERYRRLFESSKDGILILDYETGSIIDLNPFILAMLGYSRDGLLGKKLSDIGLIADTSIAEKIFGTLIKEEYVRYDNLPLLAKDGSSVAVEFTSNVYRVNHGRVIRCNIRNISEHVRIEDELQKSDAKYRDLVENAGTIIMKTNTEGKIAYFNEFAQKFFGFSESEILGCSIIGTIMPETESVTGRDLEYIVKDEIVHPEKYAHHETEITKKDGGRFWVAWRNKPLYDEAGKIYNIVRFGLDITDRRNAEEALFQANKKLNLLSSITRHDILNQLTALSGYIELSKEATQDSKMLEFINHEKRATNTIQRLISFTRDYQDVGQYRPMWQNINTIVHLLAKTVDLYSTNLIINLSNLEIYADPLLEKVVYTLLENAMRHGGPPNSIRFSYKFVDKGCLILFEDDGTGVAAADKEKIFERGYGKHTGFGLFLSREILGITGFSIHETGTPGEGVRFEIFVPKGAFRIVEKKP